jgi:hypothetical protein
MYLVIRMKGDFLRNCLLALSGISLCLLVLADDGLAFWVKSLLFNRTLGGGGWVSYVYYEFFTSNKLTYFSHVNIVNYLTDEYPYGALGLGQVIGLQYVGSSSANFNGHFWASDGIAAFGIAGIYIINIVILMFLVLLNLITSKLDIRFLCLWLTGFVLGMLNLPFFTTLLSGGGLLTVLILMFVRIKDAERVSASFHPLPARASSWREYGVGLSKEPAHVSLGPVVP